jgi:cytochrome c biogenesis protein CcdA
MAVLGLAFVATCAAFYLALGYLAGSVLQARPSVARALNRLSGTGMIVIGAVLIAQRILE